MVKADLRREVWFGCPVRDCGSPFLSYHHFDPPQRVRKHNNPAGMIAICWAHHPLADVSGWTVEQFRRMKREPFLAGKPVSARFEGWNQRPLHLFAGGNWYINPSFVLRIGAHTVIGLTQPVGDDPGGIDLDVRDTEGRPVLSMEANSWNLDVIPNDLVCGTHRNNLQVEHAPSRVKLEIKFDSLEREQLDGFLERYCSLIVRTDLLISLQRAVWPIAVARLTADIPWPGRIVLNEYQMFNSRMFFSGNIYDNTGAFRFLCSEASSRPHERDCPRCLFRMPANTRGFRPKGMSRPLEASPSGSYDSLRLR